jgi:ABC-type glutathione transport system ATPase component
MDAGKKDLVLEIRQVSKAFARPSGKPLVALENINLCLRDGEILGLLGDLDLASRRSCVSQVA